MVYNVHVYTSSTILAFHASWKHRFVDSFFLLQMLLEYLQIISYFFLVLPVLTPIHIRLENGITYGINKHFEGFFFIIIIFLLSRELKCVHSYVILLFHRILFLFWHKVHVQCVRTISYTIQLLKIVTWFCCRGIRWGIKSNWYQFRNFLKCIYLFNRSLSSNQIVQCIVSFAPFVC